MAVIGVETLQIPLHTDTSDFRDQSRGQVPGQRQAFRGSSTVVGALRMDRQIVDEIVDKTVAKVRSSLEDNHDRSYLDGHNQKDPPPFRLPRQRGEHTGTGTDQKVDPLTGQYRDND